jgi:aromatic ring hydroxylase
MPHEEDDFNLFHPEPFLDKSDLEHCLGGSDKYSTLDRMKMIHETMRHVCSHDSAFHEVTTVHAEGSMAAQKMMIFHESPLKRYEEMAKVAAGILPIGSRKWESR